MTFLSIIITTYNRKELVIHTINSALDFSEHNSDRVEIIVVDDASTDFTYEQLNEIYQKELAASDIRLFRSEENLGVTGAKNLGAMQAGGEWLLFIDSDDLLIPEVAKEMLKLLQKYNKYPIIFFRCVELENGDLIGKYYQKPYELSLKDFLNFGTPGECLPVVKLSNFKLFFYYQALKGCEGLTCAEIIKQFGPAMVETLVARRYRTENDDRLSSVKGVLSRACFIAKYHSLILVKFYKELFVISILKTMAKAFCYWLYCFIYKAKH